MIDIDRCKSMAELQEWGGRSPNPTRSKTKLVRRSTFYASFYELLGVYNFKLGVVSNFSISITYISDL